MDQKISAQLGIIELHEVVPIVVEKGDFIQVEITANDDIFFGLPPSKLPGGWFTDRVDSCRYGVLPQPHTCVTNSVGNTPTIAYGYLVPLYPDAKPIIISKELKKVEIIGGYVIFAGN